MRCNFYSLGFVVFRTTTFCLNINPTWKYWMITFLFTLFTSRTFLILNPSWKFLWNHFCCAGLQGHSEGSEGVRSAGDHFDIEVIVDISKTRWSYSDTVAKMTRRWDFPLRKSSFLIGLRWDQTLSSIMSNFNQIYPPESRSEESKLQSRLLQKLGLHSIQCSLWNLNHLHRRWRDPLHPWVPRPCTQFCSHLRRRVRRSRKRNIFQHILHTLI